MDSVNMGSFKKIILNTSIDITQEGDSIAVHSSKRLKKGAKIAIPPNNNSTNMPSWYVVIGRIGYRRYILSPLNPNSRIAVSIPMGTSLMMTDKNFTPKSVRRSRNPIYKFIKRVKLLFLKGKQQREKQIFQREEKNSQKRELRV